jgi:pimeloyl-ACP methyl ester carboxylesterase
MSNPINVDRLTIGKLEWSYRSQKPIGTADAPVVVFLHGLPATSLMWTGVMPLVAEAGWQSIAPDWIGFGDSSKNERDEFDYKTDTFIAALTEFLNALNIDSCALVVQGFLGTMGIQFALRNPTRIDRLAILNAPLAANIKLPWTMKRWGLPLIGEAFGQDPLSIDSTLEKGCKFIIEEPILKQYRQPYLRSSDAGRSLVATVANLQLERNITEVSNGLKTAPFPIRLVWGINDPWLSIEPAREIVKVIPKAELTEIIEAAHYPQEHWYPQVGGAIVNFLKRTIF